MGESRAWVVCRCQRADLRRSRPGVSARLVSQARMTCGDFGGGREPVGSKGRPRVVGLLGVRQMEVGGRRVGRRWGVMELGVGVLGVVAGGMVGTCSCCYNSWWGSGGGFMYLQTHPLGPYQASQASCWSCRKWVRER